MFIHNISGTEKTYIGQSIDDAAFWSIPNSKLVHYANDEILLSDIMSGDASISIDGVNDISEKVEMVNTLKGIYVEMSGKSAIQKAIPVVNYKPEESSFAKATHDFCNKTTWFTGSIRVTDEVATNSGDDLTYNLANDYLIDVVNGIVNRQDIMQEYAVEVKVNDVVVTNYSTNHKLGTITFDATTTDTVKVTYSYATTSEWVIEPDAGKLLIIEHSELQFSTDVKINTPVRFEIWIYNPFFGSTGHPLENYDGKIEYSSVQYNSIRDIINEANLGTGVIPQVGDLPADIHVFPFNYVTVKPIQSSYQAELRIRSVGDIELTGSYGTASFYLVSRDE